MPWSGDHLGFPIDATKKKHTFWKQGNRPSKKHSSKFGCRMVWGGDQIRTTFKTFPHRSYVKFMLWRRPSCNYWCTVWVYQVSEEKKIPIWSFVKIWFCNGVHLGFLIDKKSLTFLEGHIVNIPIKENSIIHAHAVSHKIFEILANQKAKLALASMLNFWMKGKSYKCCTLPK